MKKILKAFLLICSLFFSTISIIAQSIPGGIGSGLKLWISADSKTNTSDNLLDSWGYLNNNFSFSSSGVNRPLLVQNVINFSPALSFTGNQFLDGPVGADAPITVNNPAYCVIAVWQTNIINDFQRVWTQGNFLDFTGEKFSLATWNDGRYGNEFGSSPFDQQIIRSYSPNAWNISSFNLLNAPSNDFELTDDRNISTSPIILTSGNLGAGSRNIANTFHRIGATWTGSPVNTFLNGSIAEIIVYDTSLTTLSRNKIFSYLAIKYGIALETDLISSAGNVIWNATINNAYNHSVFGLALDTVSGLHVTKSNSIENGSGNGVGQSGKANVILSNPSALTTNETFLLIGNNNGPVAEALSEDVPSSLAGFLRLGREWKVQRQGNPGTVDLSVDLTGITVSGSVTNDFRLMIDEDGDGDFSTGTSRYYTPKSYISNIATFDTLTLNNGEVFTLITRNNTGPLAASDLIISEYAEGSSNNKALELFNGTGNNINLTTGNYIIQMYFNGNTSAGLTVTLNGNIAPGGVFVLANSLASFASASYVNQVNSGNWFNGNDAIVLRKGGPQGAIVDVIGQIGVNPGIEWGSGLTSTADNTLRRKFSVCNGDVNSVDSFNPANEWDGFIIDDFTGLGAHTDTCAVPLSTITVNPLNLSFVTAASTSSAEQSYVIQSTNLSVDVKIKVPQGTNFRISTISGGPFSDSLIVPFQLVNAGPVNIYVSYHPLFPGVQSGNIRHSSGSSFSDLILQGITTGANGITRIYDIQGAGTASVFDGVKLTTEGVVTADFQSTGQLGGFYIQDTTGDGNTLTSDGIFVFDTSHHIQIGDYVRLTGEVDEFFQKTELKNIDTLTTLSVGNSLLPPIMLTFPIDSVSSFERYEGMRVRFWQTLTVSETFNLGRFGEVVLSNGRLFNPTNFVDPNNAQFSDTSSNGNSNIAEVFAQQDFNNRNKILLDDGSSVENPAIVPYLNPVDTTLRLGSSVSSLTGILDFDFGVYRIQPTVNLSFGYSPRPPVPSVNLANIKVASFNVLNYFNGNGTGGGFPTSRGADNLSEFNRQRTKIINALKKLNADIVGLIEIENDGNDQNSAIADLVNGLNLETAPGTYAFVPDPAGINGNTGTDEIKLALIYKPASVIRFGPAISDMNPVYNRPPLAQTFIDNSSGEKFTVIINHFKSKSCTGATGLNVDQLDGQGCFNDLRKSQARALLLFIDSLKTATNDPDLLVMGDLNSYAEEDPIDILRSGRLVEFMPGNYSYVFEGQSGSLDYTFTTDSLSPKVSGGGHWHINADEPVLKDYNQENNPPYVYSNDAYRSSDHDPVLIGLKLGNARPTVTITSPVNNISLPAASTIILLANASDADGTINKVEFFNNGIKFLEDNIAPYGITSSNSIEPGNYVLTAKAFDNNGDSAISDTIRITITGCFATGFATGEGYLNITGNQVANLTSSPNFPGNPGITVQIGSLEYENVGENYGARLSGYLCAPMTGDYRFYIAGDDQAGLFLSTDADPDNKILVAYNETPVAFHEWLRFTTQQSAPIRLVRGARYYFETLHKQSTGANHMSVGWVLPDGTPEGPIPGSRLSPVDSSAQLIVAGQSFRQAIQTLQLSNVTRLTVKAFPNPSEKYFTIVTRSNSDVHAGMIMTDVLGRVIEKRTNIPANGTLQIGNGLNAGIYFLEITQGNQKERLKLIKK